jgi:hypothetical protein
MPTNRWQSKFLLYPSTEPRPYFLPKLVAMISNRHPQVGLAGFSKGNITHPCSRWLVVQEKAMGRGGTACRDDWLLPIPARTWFDSHAPPPQQRGRKQGYPLWLKRRRKPGYL